MKDITISDDIFYIGADDKDIDLFESQYVVPNGISYNSYLIKDEKTYGPKGTLLSDDSSGTGFTFPTTIVRKMMALENIQKGGKQK